MSRKTIQREHVVFRAPTKPSYIKRSVSPKNVDRRNFWFFDLGVKTGNDISFYFRVGFQIRNAFPNAANDIGVLYRRQPVSAQCNIGTER